MAYSDDHSRPYGRYLADAMPDYWKVIDSPDRVHVRWQGLKGETLDVLDYQSLHINKWQHRWTLTIPEKTIPEKTGWYISGQITGRGHTALLAILAAYNIGADDDDKE
jgi:hypothetical protein